MVLTKLGRESLNVIVLADDADHSSDRPGALAKALGQELVLWVIAGLGLEVRDTLVVVHGKSQAWNVSAEQSVRDCVCVVAPLIVCCERFSEGAAAAVLAGLEELSKVQRKEPVLVVDCSCIIADAHGSDWSGPAAVFRDVSSNADAIFTYRDESKSSSRGTVRLDADDRVQEVSWTQRLSDWSLVGAYGFQDGSKLVAHCDSAKAKGVTGGLAALASHILLNSDARFHALKLPESLVHPVWKREELTAFCCAWPRPPKMRFVFDLGCLLTVGSEASDEIPKSIEPTVSFCRWLYSQGHEIVIQSAGGMSKHSGNVGAAIAEVGEKTLAALRQARIEYHELALGAPHGHMYIGRAVNPCLGSLEELTGFHMHDGPRAVEVSDRASAMVLSPSHAKEQTSVLRLRQLLAEREAELKETLAELECLRAGSPKSISAGSPSGSPDRRDHSSAKAGSGPDSFAPQSRVESTKQDPTAGVQSLSLASDRSGLNVIIPMAGGLPEDFVKAGHHSPLPLINVAGQPILFWMIDQLKLQDNDEVFIALPSSMESRYNVMQRLRDRYKHRIIEIPISFKTCGWAETALCAMQRMSATQLGRRTVCIDCHSIIHGFDVLGAIRKLPSDAAGTVYFDPGDDNKHVRYSFIRLDDSSRVVDIREKVAISTHANAGVYAFPSGRQVREALVNQIDATLEPKHHTGAAYYASSLMRRLIKSGPGDGSITIMGIRCPRSSFHSVGSQAELEVFLGCVARREVTLKARMTTFCFNLERTLVNNLDEEGTAVPVQANIELVRELSKAGHRIIVETLRSASQGRAIFEVLHTLEIPYNEIHFGKPAADVYIDDLAMTATDLRRDLGWAQTGNDTAAIEGGVAARAFNLVSLSDEGHVVKTSDRSVLRGEIYYYRNIPPAVAELFPRAHEIHDGEGLEKTSLILERIPGVIFSHLSVAVCLTPGRFRRLFESLNRLHAYSPQSSTNESDKLEGDALCENYAPKLKKRFEKYQQLYASFQHVDCQQLLTKLLSFLEGYQAEQRYQHSWFIHGDPVFSNCLLTPAGQVKFIDMRGEVGDILTTQGDLCYDLAKVYQCLCGYDFMLLDQTIGESTAQALDELRSLYWRLVGEKYPNVRPRDIRLLTATLYFSMVPLHETRERMQRFLQAAQSILAVEGLF